MPGVSLCIEWMGSALSGCRRSSQALGRVPVGMINNTRKPQCENRTKWNCNIVQCLFVVIMVVSLTIYIISCKTCIPQRFFSCSLSSGKLCGGECFMP